MSQGGPVVLKTMFEIVFSVTDQALRSLILFEVFATASDDEFIKHASTICTSYQLNLLPSMGVEELLDNVESFYQSRVKPNK
eukprot:6418340-Ditylum_brightwellii.AAC.1